MLTKLGIALIIFFFAAIMECVSFLENVESGNVTRCLVHPFKPYACRNWNPSLYRKECQEGLIKCWGLTVSASGQLEGAKERLRGFYSLLNSLLSENVPTPKPTLDDIISDRIATVAKREAIEIQISNNNLPCRCDSCFGFGLCLYTSWIQSDAYP